MPPPKKPKEEDESFVHYLVKTTKGVYPASVLKAAEKPTSKQLKEETTYLKENDLVPYPFEASSLLSLKDNCSYFDACVKQIAKDVIGQGWTIVLKEGKKEAKKEKESIEEFIANSGGDRDESFEQTLERGLIDWSCIGWWGWEVSRGNKDIVDGMWHVPAQTFYVHKSHDKYCQMRNQKKVWFKRFGMEGDINLRTGESENAEGDNRANELIFYRNYYPQSDYYGAPNILSSVGSVLGFVGVRDYNLAFFENYGIPAYLITLEGKWSKDSAKQISDFLDVEIKKSENAHKTMVIHPSKDSKITVEPLGIEVKEGSFTLYRKDIRDEILVPYRMPPYRIGIAEVGKLGGSTSPESNKIYYHGVIEPLERDINGLITNKIFNDGLKAESYKFVLNKMDIRDMDASVKRWESLFKMAAMTPNQIRKELGLDDYPEGDQYYTSSTFIPVGEEAVEKRERALWAEFEELKAKVVEAIEKEKK